VRLLSVLASGAVLLVANACKAPPTFDEAHQAAIRDSIGVVLEAFLQYSAVGNWDALLGLYADTPDFRWIEDGTIEYGSVDAIRRAIADMPQGMRIVTTHDDVTITPLAPGLAWVSLQFHSMFLQPSGTGFAVSGASTMVMKDGSSGWHIVGGHSSTSRSHGGGE